MLSVILVISNRYKLWNTFTFRAQPLFGLMSPVSGMSSNMHYRKPEGEEDPFNQVAKQCHLLKVTVGKLYKV